MATEPSALRLLKAERCTKILEWLVSHNGSARLAELSQMFHVSPITIRRDVSELSRQGLLEVIRGGVMLSRRGATFEPAYQQKLSEETIDKEHIAEAALQTLQDGDTLLLDGGTTVGAMAKHLINRRVTVVSNALNVQNVLANSRYVRLIAIGGIFRGASQTFLGPMALSAIEDLRFDVAFLGTEGFDEVSGLEVPDADDAAFKRAAIQAARDVWILSTGRKYRERRLYRFSTWEPITGLITNEVSDTLVKELGKRQVSVLSVGS